MRKLIIFVALFLLLATPALAADNAPVEATINVSAVWNIQCADGAITFTINNGEYDNGEVKPDNDEATAISIQINRDYNFRINRDTPAGWPTTWNLYANEGATCASDQSNYLVTTAGTAGYWPIDKPPTNGDTWYFYFIIDPIAYVDDWVGNHIMTIMFTLM